MFDGSFEYLQSRLSNIFSVDFCLWISTNPDFCSTMIVAKDCLIVLSSTLRVSFLFNPDLCSLCKVLMHQTLPLYSLIPFHHLFEYLMTSILHKLYKHIPGCWIQNTVEEKQTINSNTNALTKKSQIQLFTLCLL